MEHSFEQYVVIKQRCADICCDYFGFLRPDNVNDPETGILHTVHNLNVWTEERLDEGIDFLNAVAEYPSVWNEE